MSDRKVLYRVKTESGAVIDVIERSPLASPLVGLAAMSPGERFEYGGDVYELVEVPS